MAFPDSWMSELLAKNDIVSVISSYMELKPKGRRLWGLCPVHGEKTASFSVSPDKQLFYCFGCHIGGSVIQFIMEVERLSVPEAIEFLANRVGMAMPEEVDDKDLQKRRAYRERLAEANRLAARFYMETLLGEGGVSGRAYLKKRGIKSDSVRRFGLGYAPDTWDSLMTFLLGKGFAEKELLDAGLLVKNERSGRVYDAYRGRLIFPIVATDGRVVGFGARTLKPDEKPKYINTGDTPLYNKRNNLYGLNLQKSAKPADLVMVEGYTDVIGLAEAGVTNVVASLGTALTQQQARLIKRFVNTVYIAYDGDAAGQNATIRGLDILSNEGLTVRVIVFPNEQDPDEFVRSEGKDAFDTLKDDALSLNAFKLESMARAYHLDREDEREQYAKEGCRFISSLSPVEQERYYARLSKKTGYAAETLKAQGGKAGKTGLADETNRFAARPARRATKRAETERSNAEAEILAVMYRSEAASRTFSEAGGMQRLSLEAHKAFAKAILDAWDGGKEPNAAMIAGNMEGEAAERVGTILREEIDQADPEKTVRDCLKRIERCDIMSDIEEIKQALSDPALSDEEKAQLLRQMQQLNLRMRAL